MFASNPFDWQSHHPAVEIPRAEVDNIAGLLAGGGSSVVLGGRGMGKSVFLGQLKARLEEQQGIRVVLLSAPPPELTVRACLDELAEILGVAPGLSRSVKIVDTYFSRGEVPPRLVLLYDEFDRYAQKGDASANPPGRGFFNDLEAARRDIRELGVLATGSLGVFVARDVLGSSFLSRAYHAHLAPFHRSDVERLARPFVDRGQSLSVDILDALYLATGAIPALLTYGLQELWRRESISSERDVLEIFADFRRGHADYLRDVLRSVADPELSAAPQRVLEKIRQAAGPLRRSELEAALAPSNGPLDLDLIDVLRLLESAGLIRIQGALDSDDPLYVRPISSLLDLPTRSAEREPLGARLLSDLATLLGKLHRASADFFRPVAGEKKRLVPESVFAAHLALGLELLGWRVEREAQSAAGRTDLKLRRNGSSEVLLIEVKIWGRNDSATVQRQIEGYWTPEVKAGVVVQITDAEIADWAERYQHKCFAPLNVEATADEAAELPIRARFRVPMSGHEGIFVDHLLVALARRP